MIESDFDSSGQFSDSEIEILALRLSNVPGVKVNAELLKTTAMQSDRSLVTILGYLDQLKQNDIPEDQRIFQLDESNLPQY